MSRTPNEELLDAITSGIFSILVAAVFMLYFYTFVPLLAEDAYWYSQELNNNLTLHFPKAVPSW